MAASYDEVQGWLIKAKEIGAKWLVSVCDTFDHSD